MEINLQEAEEYVIKFARELGEWQLKESLSRNYKTETKSSKYDLVTDIDKESERRVVAKILEKYPTHNIIGEEDTYPKTASPYTWVIDPIDGTTNFFKNIPLWSCSIGLVYKDQPVMGVINCPYLRDTFHSSKDNGAYRNDTRIYVSAHPQIDGGVFITGFYYDRSRRMNQTIDTVRDILSRETLGFRRLGTASIDIAYVAQGSADAYFEHILSPWDFMAGYSLILEAGGIVTDFKGETKNLQRGEILVCNKLIHKEMIALLDNHFPIGYHED